MISGRYFRNPVSFAKIIMNNTEHCALTGEGALNFAVENGIPICVPRTLITERAKSLNVSYADFQAYVRRRFWGFPTADSVPFGDTVSAVARDVNGHLACATSTGNRHLRPLLQTWTKTSRPVYTRNLLCDFMRDFDLLIDVNEWISF